MSAGHVPKLHVLLVAKAPVAGQAKTRLTRHVGNRDAADLAATALLDTLAAVESVTTPERRMVALTGDLHRACRGGHLRRRLGRWRVTPQRGDTFAERLVHAHRDAGRAWGADALVVQIGMDTPQVTGDDMSRLAAAAIDARSGGACALGPAVDGGWWGLATSRPAYADHLCGVPMSRADTCALTAQALRDGGASVALAHELRDVDDVEDAIAVARDFPDLAFSRRFRQLYADARTTGGERVVAR